MSRRSIKTRNPVRVIRLEKNYNLEFFARRCNVHMQTLYLQECGVYPTVLPAIMDVLVNAFHQDKKYVEEEYRQYVKAKRKEFGDKFGPIELPESSLDRSPTRALREYIGCSRQGFAKAICVHPSQLLKLENGEFISLFSQLEDALRGCGFTESQIEELNYRTAEFYYGRIRR